VYNLKDRPALANMNVSSTYEGLVSSVLLHELESVFTVATGLSLQLAPSYQLPELFRIQQNENPFCGLMNQFRDSCTACQQVHRDLQQRIAENPVPQVIRCFAGLVEFAVPVLVEGRHIATLLGGQVLYRPPTKAQLARLRRQLKNWDISQDVQQVETAFLQTRVISPAKFAASVRMLKLLATLMAANSSPVLLITDGQDQPCITRAKNFINDHIKGEVHARDVAGHLHLSTYYFCKFFKKETGMGFSEYVARLRVEKAKHLLIDSDLAIHDAAERAGFGSVSQFNRAFHRFAGYSPKEYRASIRKSVSS
jgi:AraC-like DNA-binding protein